MPWKVIADGGAWYVVDDDGVSTGTMYLHEDDAVDDAYALNRVHLYASSLLKWMRALRSTVALPGDLGFVLDDLLDAIEGRANG